MFPNPQVRRIQPVSAPRKPPDIQNLALFPPIEDSGADINCGSSPFAKEEVAPSSRGGVLSEDEKKLRRLENKLQGRRQQLSGSRTEDELTGRRTTFDLSCPEVEEHPLLITSKKRVCPRSAEFFGEITPEIATRIDQMAVQHSALLDRNCSPNPNILEELSLLLQLIASSRPLTDVGSCTLGGNLTTMAQQVFFAIKVLTLQLNGSLVSIDPEVIQLLVEKYPHRIPKPFRKHFQGWIEDQSNRNVQGDNEFPSRKPSEYHRCVTFRSETDGRSNFPSQGNFHAFCKQRDLFYSIKSGWEEGNQPLTNGSREGNNISSFGKATPSPSYNGYSSSSKPIKIGHFIRDVVPADPLHKKIRTLFNLNSSWVNLSHFAALLSEQFIMDSMEESREKTKVVQDDVMKVLQLSDLDRLTKLSNRMSSTSESDSKSKDSFTFLQYFITTTASPAFNQHLVDRICYEIREIEKSLDSAETGSISDADGQFLLKKAVLLAKLLGYVYFLPYREKPGDNIRPNNTPTLDSETLYSKHVELRKHQIPPIELSFFLCNAVHRSRLTFTLPWIMELLSAADYVSLQLPSYKEILLRICSAYKSLCSVTSTEQNIPSKLCLANKNFLRFWCGNFFSLEVFPDSVLYCDNTEQNLLEGLANFEKYSSQTPSTHNDVEIHIDDKAGFGEQLSRFYFSVNFNQMKFILHSGLQQQQQFQTNLSSIGNNRQHRHIRPISATKSNLITKAVSTDTELQRQLQHSFFDGNSPSVKRTVDFVSDRIASNYVKLLRKTMAEQRGELAKRRMFEESAAETCRKEMLEGVINFIDTKCKVTLSLLLGESLSLDALKVCQQITERQTTDKVSAWVHTHIKAEMFPEIPLPDVPESPNQKSEPEKVDVPSTKTDDNLSFSVMIGLHRCMKRFHEKKSVSESAIDEILNCRKLSDVSGLIGTLLDFGVTLIAFAPSLLNLSRQTKLVELWKPSWNNDCQLLSPRNILILSQSHNDDKTDTTTQSWTRLTEIIIFLIKEKLIDFQTVEQDCFRLLKENLTRQECKMVSQLLQNLSQLPNLPDVSEDDRSREVMSWISWIYSEDQDGDF